jgi:hypothetical protein
VLFSRKWLLQEAPDAPDPNLRRNTLAQLWYADKLEWKGANQMKTTQAKDFSKEDGKCEPERPGSEPTEKTLIVTTAVMLGAVAVAVWMFKPTPEFHFTGTCPSTQSNEALDRYVGQWDGRWDDTWYMSSPSAGIPR